MARLKCLSNGLLVPFLALACFSSCVQAQVAKPGTAPPPLKKYVLDFSGSQDRGVSGGTFQNFAFNLDTSQPVRKISIKRDEQRKDLIATYDYADCTRGQEPLLQRPLGGLAPGNSAWVDYVDIEMIPLAQRGVKWTGGVCYGYRTPAGAWHWNLTTTPLTLDPATGLIRARIWVKEASVDGLKLVFDYSVPRQSVRTVTIATLPAGAATGK